MFLDGEEAVVEWQGNDHTYGSRYYVEAAKKAGTLSQIRALILVDMIGDRDLRISREQSSTRWLTDVIWATAKRMNRREFIENETPIEDDHIPFLQAGVQAVDIIDLDYPAWHTAGDTLDKLGPVTASRRRRAPRRAPRDRKAAAQAVAADLVSAAPDK